MNDQWSLSLPWARWAQQSMGRLSWVSLYPVTLYWVLRWWEPMVGKATVVDIFDRATIVKNIVVSRFVTAVMSAVVHGGPPHL